MEKATFQEKYIAVNFELATLCFQLDTGNKYSPRSRDTFVSPRGKLEF